MESCGFFNNVIVQWGKIPTGNGVQVTVVFPLAYTEKCGAFKNVGSSNSNGAQDRTNCMYNISLVGATTFAYSAYNSNYFAIGF